MDAFKNWIRDHDDRWSFVILYVGGAVALSVFMNLFWVILLMTGNFCLKIYRNYLVAKPLPVLTSLWQVNSISASSFSPSLSGYTPIISLLRSACHRRRGRDKRSGDCRW